MIPAAFQLSFLSIVLLGILGFFALLFLVGFVIIPLPRYIGLRVWLYLRCLFSKAVFRPVGFLPLFFPHFRSDRPDYFLLSGNKLYMVKLKTCRKMKTRITFVSDRAWQFENIRGVPPKDNGSFYFLLVSRFHEFRVNRRLRRAPQLHRYAAAVNRALAGEKIDCVPVVLFSPSVREMLTADQIAMLDGDVTFYGSVVANGFYPAHPEKSAVEKKEAKRIIKIAKQELKKEGKR